jgi:hypothetical protein
MAWRYACFTLLLISVITARFVVSHISGILTVPTYPIPTDPESQLASGGKLPLMCADQSSLELISGVSSTLTAHLLRNREHLVREAIRSGERAALLSVPGIADKRVDTFLRYISFDHRCTRIEPYTLFDPSPTGRIPVR